MDINDSRLRNVVVDGQLLYIPSPAAWDELASTPFLSGLPLTYPKGVFEAVRRDSAYSEILCALGFVNGRVLFYELLCHDGELYRVFIERVICESCGAQAFLSATPCVTDIYYGCEDVDAAMGRGLSLSNLSCLECGAKYERRYTVWLAGNNVS